ncbi:MAG: hypothetical protein KAV87_22440 [Desulfobacteraceae bacterium]|nr:hypothetical protein [Desulfobacteraceae bacterium]
MPYEIKFEAWIVDKYEEDGNTPKTFKMIKWSPEFFADTSPVVGYGSSFPDPDDPCVTLRQYLNLKDVNGKEWYYKDVGEFENGDRFVIECEDFVQYFAEWIGEPEDEEQIQELDEITGAVKIGNAFENPELLKTEG